MLRHLRDKSPEVVAVTLLLAGATWCALDPPRDPAAPDYWEPEVVTTAAPIRTPEVVRVAPDAAWTLDVLEVTGQRPVPPPPPRPAPRPRTRPEAPRPAPAPDVVERFEDGSWRNHTTGETGCTPGALCDQEAPALPDLTALPPCVYEDGSGGPIPCYWDARTRGNGIGESYAVWTEM